MISTIDRVRIITGLPDLQTLGDAGGELGMLGLLKSLYLLGPRIQPRPGADPGGSTRPRQRLGEQPERAADPGELGGVQAGPADQRAVDVGLGEDLGRRWSALTEPP